MNQYQKCIAVLFCLLLFFVAAPFGAAYAQCIDNDSDGWGNPADASCTSYAAGRDDCDDNDNLVYPWSPNLTRCDGKDTNCDGTFPDIPAETDTDGDGWPNCNDCQTGDPAINPGVTEGPPGRPDVR